MEIKTRRDDNGFKCFDIENLTNLEQFKEFIRVLNEEKQFKVKISLLGATYAFSTSAEKSAWLLGFEACWDLIDELADPFTEEDAE